MCFMVTVCTYKYDKGHKIAQNYKLDLQFHFSFVETDNNKKNPHNSQNHLPLQNSIIWPLRLMLIFRIWKMPLSLFAACMIYKEDECLWRFIFHFPIDTVHLKALPLIVINKKSCFKLDFLRLLKMVLKL